MIPKLFRRKVNPLQALKDFNDAIVDIAEKTNPAVVTVNTEKTQEVRVVNPFSFFGNALGATGR